ncbi:hypothetical protein F5B22DRAFT_479232 [Xylaria bambusicola]|uniref:uncharacterized protein n=1 Tax=Xylaria bambusicola TaxID=326684 RepID=UPI002007B210|nr:uncharacterized protein F5B22DRAFT_479232 [Xylaria bambusicola]KAI0506121.1 hypothetical protein F5B22DRAFT_479232 [Xylaria bambusicola]
MDLALIRCNKCHLHMGVLTNLWFQIGKNYISPVVYVDGALDVAPDGAIRHGEKGTIMGNCRVQGVICVQCRSMLGSKCLRSTINHVLQEGSLVLRMPSIQIMNPNSHDTIEPIIQRVLSLKNPLGHDDSHDDNESSSFDEDHDHEQTMTEDSDLNHLLDKIDAQGERIELLDTAGIQVVASLDRSMRQIDEAIRNLKSEIAHTKKELSNSSDSTRKLTSDVWSTKSQIEEVKRTLEPLTTQCHIQEERFSIENAITEAKVSLQVEIGAMSEISMQKVKLLGSQLENMQRDLKEFRNAAQAALLASDANNGEIATLKSEIERLRQEVALERSSRPSPTSSVFASRDVDILTSNITKIGNKASQVEPLQMELELLKSRVQRMEAQTSEWQKEPAPSFQHKDTQHPLSVSPTRKYITSCTMEDGLDSNTSTSTIPILQDNGIGRSSLRTTRKEPKTGPPRITKSGAIDKRSLRNRSKLATTSCTASKG